MSDNELQLHEDDKGPSSSKRHHSHANAKKLEAIGHAEKFGNSSAARMFKVDRKTIRDWRELKEQLIRQR